MAKNPEEPINPSRRRNLNGTSELENARLELRSIQDMHLSATKRHDKISNILIRASEDFEHAVQVFKEGHSMLPLKEEIITMETLHLEKMQAQEKWVAAEEALNAAQQKVHMLETKQFNKTNSPKNK